MPTTMTTMTTEPDIQTTEGIFRIYRDGQNPRICVRTDAGGWHPIARYAGNPAGIEKAWTDLAAQGRRVHTRIDGTTTDADAPAALVRAAPSALRHASDEISERDMAVAVSAQWQRAQDGLVEIIKFGALMIRAEQGLAGASSRAGMYKGRTLKGWLSQHCPEINYHTAIGYRDAALGVAAAAEMPDALPLLALMDGEAAFAPEMDAVRARVMQIISGASIALLKGASRRGGAREGAGRPPKTPVEPDPDAALTDALMEADKLIGDLRTWALVDDGMGGLPDDVLERALTQIGDVVRRGREILAGRKTAAKTRRMA